MGMGMGGANQMGFDANAAYRSERETLGISPHEWISDQEERVLLGDRYPMETVDEVGIDLSRYSKVDISYFIHFMKIDFNCIALQ